MQGQFTERQSRRRGGGGGGRPPGTSSSSATYKARVVEGAGRATADCAAVWCCCPCGVANLILFAVYRVPAGICRRRRRKGRETSGKGGGRECEEDGREISMLGDVAEMKEGDGGGNEEVRLLDEEMLMKFHEAGFWRSPSRMFSSGPPGRSTKKGLVLGYEHGSPFMFGQPPMTRQQLSCCCC